jgi:hypothetical protein
MKICINIIFLSSRQLNTVTNIADYYNGVEALTEPRSQFEQCEQP